MGTAPGVPEGFASSKLGGIGFLPVADALGEAAGARFDFGGLMPGFSKLGGVLCWTTAAGTKLLPQETA